MNDFEQYSEWREYYNYSSMREGLLSWYSFKKNCRILEVTPQMGALTGLLSSKCCELVCLVRTENDKISLEKRFLKSKNIKYLYKNQIEGAFDYIVAYDPFRYYEQSEQVIEYYKEWNSLLSHNGVLLLAVRNVFSPLSSLSIKNNINRADDMLSLKEELGTVFKRIRFNYVYPDMVFPQEIYTDECPPDRNIALSVTPYSSSINESYENLWKLYKKSFELMDLKNIAGSFLVECSQNGELSDVHRVKITSDRKNGTITVIRKNKVEKISLDKEQPENLKTVADNHNALMRLGINVVTTEFFENKILMPRINAPLLIDVIKTLDDTDAMLLWERFYENIKKSSEKSECAPEWDKKYAVQDWGVILKTGYIEMTPINCFYDNGDFVFFDQEYSVQNCPIGFILFRGLAHVYGENSECSIVRRMKEQYGLNELWDIFSQAEQEFLNTICEDENKKMKEDFFVPNQYQYWEFQRMSVQIIKYLFADLGEKEIVCYGAGDVFTRFMHGYGRLCKISFVVDSNPELWGKKVFGVPVKSISEIKPKLYRVIITSRDVENISNMLLAIGIDDIRMIYNNWE